MEKHASTLFLEIYRKRFGATYDATQESTWRWLTAQYISDFYAPAYTRGNPPDTCLTLREGHRPKMFLWMLEEFAFILCHLRKDDQDGAMVLGHELLLLARSRCRRKRGSRRPGATPLDKLPTCSYQTLERAMSAPDTIQLERLAWAVYDNVMGPSETPPLCGFETYDQIIRRLASKAYKGVHTRCPARTSASFGAEGTTDIVENPESRKDTRPPRYTMTRDVRQEFRGSYSAYKEKQDIAGRDQSYASSHAVDPNTHGMKWMKERQRSYRDIQLEFWLLLRPLTDGSEERTRQLARRLLSVWHWSSAVEPPTYPPAPTSLDIGYWLRRTRKNNNRQFWIEAYACALQRVAEASVGRRWIAFEGRRVPKIARVVEVFLHATGTRVPPERIRQCWPVRRTEIPMQSLEGIRQDIVRKLDEVATRCPSPIAWDPFAFPLTDDMCWREEALCYRPGKTLDVGARMPGFKIMLQDDKGEYPHTGRALIFEGSMLVYDPQRDIAQWVPVRGMSGTLTMPELRAAHDLNNMVPSPLSELPAAKPPPIEVMKCIPAGAESDSNSSFVDSGDEWDKTETVGPSRSSTPTTKIGPTWADVHAAAQEEEMAKSQVPSWGDMPDTAPTEEEENWDAVDTQSAAEDQFDDVEEVLIHSVMDEQELDSAVEGEPQQGEAEENDVE